MSQWRNPSCNKYVWRVFHWHNFSCDKWSDDNSSCDNTEQKQNTSISLLLDLINLILFNILLVHAVPWMWIACQIGIKTWYVGIFQNLCTVYDKFTGFLIFCRKRSMCDIPWMCAAFPFCLGNSLQGSGNCHTTMFIL